MTMNFSTQVGFPQHIIHIYTVVFLIICVIFYFCVDIIYFSNKQNKSITIDLIQDVVAAYFNLRVEDLKSQRRTRNVAYPRQIAMYLSRKLTDMSLPKIGEEFGGRDHTTVIHAYEKISESLNKDESLEHTINDITKKLTQK